MPDKKVINRHPLHPALVHFPIACWGLSHPADFVVLLGINRPVFGLDWWAVSSLLIWGGIISALPAVVCGIYDFMQLPDEDELMGACYRHVGFVGSAWVFYFLSGSMRLGSDRVLLPPSLLPPCVSIAGLICLCIGAWYGGRMVYKYHLGKNAGHGQP